MYTLTYMKEAGGIGMELATQKLRLRNVPDLSEVGSSCEGLNVVITGPTEGIGKEAAAEFARRGAHVYMACRNVPKGEARKKELEQEAATAGRDKPSLEVMECDVSSMASVRKFVAAWEAKHLPLHILVNNAGILALNTKRTLTSEGFESHLATNYLGPFLLSILLLPSLRAASAEAGRPARVVNVASRLHYLGNINRDDMNMDKSFSVSGAYSLSKLLQVIAARETQRRTGSSVRSVAIHPGEVLTAIVNTLPGPLQWLYRKTLGIILLTPQQGARSTVYCATAPELDDESSDIYFDSNCAACAPLPVVQDDELGRWVWDWTVKAVGLKLEELPTEPTK